METILWLQDVSSSERDVKTRGLALWKPFMKWVKGSTRRVAKHRASPGLHFMTTAGGNALLGLHRFQSMSGNTPSSLRPFHSKTWRMPTGVHLPPGAAQLELRTRPTVIGSPLSLNLVARTSLRSQSRDECRWNYITVNDQVAGSNPAGRALCGECVRSSAVEQVPEGKPRRQTFHHPCRHGLPFLNPLHPNRNHDHDQRTLLRAPRAAL